MEWHEKTKDKKAYQLAKEYFQAQGVNAFKEGRPSKDYWAVSTFFKRLDESVLNLFHEYLATIETPRQISMGALFKESEAWNTQMKVVKVEQTNLTDYLALIRSEQ